MFYIWLVSFQTLVITFSNIKMVDSQQNYVQQRFVQFNYIRDGILQMAPKNLLGIKYGNVQVNLGNILNDLQIALPPDVTWACNLQNQYTLVMCDPDAKDFGATPQKPFLHWFVANIRNCDVSNGTMIATYLSPTTFPPPVLHRYTFLMWLQTNTFSSYLLGNLGTETAGRFNFSIKATSMQIGSNPMFGNFFQGIILN